jgi:hypothetical protein
MKVDHKISLQYPYIEARFYYRKWTVRIEGVSGALFFNVVPLVVEVLVTACDVFVHPGHTECVFLLYQPHDGSTFTVFTVGETVP